MDIKKNNVQETNLDFKFMERETEKLDLQVASFIDYEDAAKVQSQDAIINKLIQTGEEQPELKGNPTYNKELAWIQRVMEKYKNTYSNKPGVSNVVKHQVPVSTNIPIVSRPYKMPFTPRSRLK